MKISLDNILSDDNNVPLLKVSIALTQSQKEKGLMFVKSMNDNHGMLFKFNREQKLSFWGLNTYLYLDVAFIDKNGYIVDIKEIKPLSQKIVQSSIPCVWAVEANSGYFVKNNINIGDKVFLHNNKDLSYLSFHKKRRKKHSNIGKTSLRNVFSQYDNDSVFLDEDIDNNNKVEEGNDEQLPVINIKDIGSILEDNLSDDSSVNDSGLNKNEIVPNEVQDNLEEENVEEIEYPTFGNVYDAYRWAEENNEIMNIVYTTEKGITINRQIEPHGHFYAKTTSRQIFVVFDRTVGDIRAFIMVNIGSFSFAKNRFIKKFRIM